MAGYGRAENVADAEALARDAAHAARAAEAHRRARARRCVSAAAWASWRAATSRSARVGGDLRAVESRSSASFRATISPYVVKAIGARQARRYFLTAERFEAAEAYRIGLLHDIVPLAQLDDRVNEILKAADAGLPVQAQRECKALIAAVAPTVRSTRR